MRTPRIAVSLAVLGTPFAAYAVTVPVSAAAAVMCQGERATIVGTAGDNVLRGGPGRDVISGLAGQDRIFGLGGDDVLCGGDGADLLDGGAGDDRLDGGRGGVQLVEGTQVRAGDEVIGGPGDDRLDSGANDGPEKVSSFGVDVVSFGDAAHGVSVDLRSGTAVGAGRDRIVVRPMWLVLSAGDDKVRGSRQPVGVSGGAGDDTIRTGPGDDEVAADDDGRFRFGGKTIGTGGDDEVSTGAGDDRVEIRDGDDVVDLGAGDDDIESAKGRDVIRGGSGDDDIFEHGRTPDDIDAGRGRDEVTDDVMGKKGERISMGPREDVRESLSVISPRAVVWDLATGLADVGGTTVELAWAARIFPDGQRRWTIRGTAEADFVQVTFSAGTSFFGLGGDDQFLGDFKAADLFDGGDGTDTYRGDEKRNNTCIAVERDEAGACLR